MSSQDSSAAPSLCCPHVLAGSGSWSVASGYWRAASHGCCPSLWPSSAFSLWQPVPTQPARVPSAAEPRLAPAPVPGHAPSSPPSPSRPWYVEDPERILREDAVTGAQLSASSCTGTPIKRTLILPSVLPPADKGPGPHHESAKAPRQRDGRRSSVQPFLPGGTCPPSPHEKGCRNVGGCLLALGPWGARFRPLTPGGPESPDSSRGSGLRPPTVTPPQPYPKVGARAPPQTHILASLPGPGSKSGGSPDGQPLQGAGV